jgi:hypothetical protein
MRLAEPPAKRQSAARTRRVASVVFSLLAYLGCTPNFDALSKGQSGGSSGSADARAGAGASAGSPSPSGGSGGIEEIPGGAPGSVGGTHLVTGSAGMDTSGGPAGGQAAAGEDSVTGGQGGGADAGGGDGLAGGAAGGMPAVVVVSASTEETAQSNFAANANDGSSDTKWCASDASAPQWWKIDLGVETAFTGFQIEFEAPVAFSYVLQVSDDDVNFDLALDETSNSNSAQVQTESVVAQGRYVRVYFATLPPADPWPHWACLREFSLLGTSVVTSGGG